MPTVELSATFIRTVDGPEHQRKIDYFDVEQRGLMLEVRRSGGKTYYQRYTDARGRAKQYKLGAADVLTLEQARRMGRHIIAHALVGSDPQSRRQELREIPTLNVFVRDRYLPFISTYKRSWRTDETVLRVHALPTLGSLPLDEITTAHLSEIVNKLREKSYAAGTINRVLVILRYLFNLARKWKVVADLDNPASGLSAGPDVQRTRFLNADEIKSVMGSLAIDENRVASQAIVLLLLTGARRNEVTQARWEYVDFERRTLLVPRSKSGKPRFVSLNGAAIVLLKSVPRSDNAYIFPSPVNGRPMPHLFFPWARIRRRAGLVDVRLHDLRHSFASILVNKGVSLYVVQNLLGHANARTTQRYAHLAHQTLLDATEVVASAIAPEKAASTCAQDADSGEPV